VVQRWDTPSLLDGTKNPFAAIDLAKHEEDPSTTRNRGDDIVKVVLREEHRFWAEMVALQTGHELGDQHGLFAFDVDDLPCR